MKALVVILASLALVGAGGASAFPPRNAPLPVIAAEFLHEVGELKVRPDVTVRCVKFSIPGDPGIVIQGAAHVRGNVLYLSTRYVCEPLAVVWHDSPIFTGRPRTSISFAGVDALEMVAHEWFHTQGVASEGQAECRGVHYTWKWLRREDLGPAALARAKRHLLDNSRRRPGYTIPASCVG